MKKLKQEYTFLDELPEGRKFRYKCRDYTTTITVDSGGLVLEYPDVFCRRY